MTMAWAANGATMPVCRRRRPEVPTSELLLQSGEAECSDENDERKERFKGIQEGGREGVTIIIHRRCQRKISRLCVSVWEIYLINWVNATTSSKHCSEWVQTRQLCTYKVAAAASDKCYEPSLHAWGLSWMWWYLLFFFSFCGWVSYNFMTELQIDQLEAAGNTVNCGPLRSPTRVESCWFILTIKQLLESVFSIECLTSHVTESQAMLQGSL